MKIKKHLVSIKIENPLFIEGTIYIDGQNLGRLRGYSSITVEDIEEGLYTLTLSTPRGDIKNSLTAKEGEKHILHMAHDFYESELDLRFKEGRELISNHGDIYRLKELISIPTLAERRSFDTRKTLLQVAVDHCFYEGVKLLLEAGATPDTSDKFGFTPLMSAGEKSNLHIVRLLLDKGTDIDACDQYHENALMKSIVPNRNSATICRLLLEHGIKTDLVSKQSGFTPLTKSLTKREFATIFKLLLKKSKEDSLSLEDNRGYSALDLSLIGGDIFSIKETIKRGIEPNNFKSIYRAFASKDQEVIAYTLDHLLKKGLDLNSLNKEGSTLLMYVCSTGYLEGVQLLLEREININARDNSGESALFYSLYYPEICSFLIENGADISAANLVGETPLMKLIPKKFQATAKLFIT